MKRILITGENGYIGNSFENWVSQWPDEYQVDKISLRNNDWKKADWSKYDVVFHAAGIAHRKITKENEHEYYKVNRDITVEAAEKAKDENVAQFIFLSTMSVFGVGTGAITSSTSFKPKNAYGKSKLEAEELIVPLQDESFSIVIVRPPMVYGKNSKGNYPLLSKFAQKSPIFPNYNNKRSMIHIDNLSEFIKLSIDKNISGYYHPQNTEYVNTSEMVKIIAKIHKNNIWMTKSFNWMIKLLEKFNVISKVFGDLYYDETLNIISEDNYQVNTLIKTIVKSEV